MYLPYNCGICWDKLFLISKPRHHWENSCFATWISQNRTHPKPRKQFAARSNKSKCHFNLESFLKASDVVQQPVSSKWHRYGFNTGNKAPILGKGAATPRRIFPSCIMEESGKPKEKTRVGRREGERGVCVQSIPDVIPHQQKTKTLNRAGPPYRFSRLLSRSSLIDQVSAG